MPLSNSTQNQLRTQYFDDYYNPSNTEPGFLQGEANDFHRILFRPKFPVQSRELTQLQTSLQAQLERLGKSSFKDGEAVLGGRLTLDTALISGQVLSTTNVVAMFDRTDNLGKYVFDTGDNTKKAHILQFLSADEGQTSNSYLLFKYQSADTFQPGTVIQAADDATVTATFAAGANSDIFSVGSLISIDEGVFFVSGFFVRVRPQSLVLNPFSDKPSFRIGLEVVEEILDELDDIVGASLLDPANQNAPGAHRFRVRLSLAKKSLDSSADAGFIELARVVDGEVLQSKITPKFVRLDELNDILARRTFDEAGDFIVDSFAPILQKNTAANSEDTFVLSLGPGKAFVRGYEIETTEPIKKVIRKGRAANAANNRTIPTTVGNFVYVVRPAASLPQTAFANTFLVDLHCVNVATINTSSAAVYNQSRIGQAKVRMIEPFSVPSNTAAQANNTIYRLHFYDVSFDSLTGNVTVGVANATAITLTIPTGNGLPAGSLTNVNDAISGVTIVLAGSVSPVSGTFSVNNYSVANATHAFVTISEFLPTLPNANTTYRLLFQPKDIDAFALRDAAVASFNAPYKLGFSFQADVDFTSKTNGNPIGPTTVNDQNDNALLFQIPETFIKANSISANTATWRAWEKTTANAQAFSTVANLVFTLSVSGNNYSLPTGNLSSTTAQQNFIIFDQTADANGHGEVVQFADVATSLSTDKYLSDVNVTAVGTTFNIQFTYRNGSVTATTRSLAGLAKTTVTGLSVRSKILHIGNTSAVVSGTTAAQSNGQIEFYTLNTTAGFNYSLKTTDVFRITKVLYRSDNTAFANSDLSTATDVTAQFVLDSGQRDNSYEYAQLQVKSSASSVIRPTGRLLVIFDWFEHQGRGYATLDSYLSSANALKGMTYDAIPDYKSPKFNNTLNLRDALDFRPVRSTSEFSAAALQVPANDSGANITYLTTTSESYLIPVSDSIWTGSYQYFLARFDKIGLFYDGTFKVIEGLDAVQPVPPTKEDGCLLLFQLKVPPYTLVNANGVPSTVSLKTFDHKRYTMRDLSKMDDRISHLQYYTSLNSLEQITNKQSVTDTDGLERFKNGILVDSFLGATVADITKSDFTASIDTLNRELRSSFRSFVMQFAADLRNSTTFNIKVIGDMATLVYNVAPFISQPLASHAVSVNPFDVGSFYGTVRLSPAVDIWKDVDNKPAQVIDLGGPSEAWINAEHPSFTNWGEWDQTWSGVTAVTPRNDFFTPPGWTPDNHPVGSLTELSWNDVTTSTTYQHQGTAYEFAVTGTTASLGNIVIDTSIIHNMRARDVVFSSDGMKPNAVVYPFFDGTNVSNFVQQANILKLADQSGGPTPFYVGQTVYVQKALSGTVATTNSNTTIVGTGSAWAFELVKGQLVRITQGVNTFDVFVSNVVSDTTATLAASPTINLAAATLSSLTPVTIADIGTRTTGNTVSYTLKVVRAIRDVDTDQAVPYAMTAGCLRPDKMVKDVSNTTTGAVLLIPASPIVSVGQSINIVSAVCKSGIVRTWNSGTASLRFDTDIKDSAVSTPGTTVFFVAGPGAGQKANIVSYNAATQTAVLDNSLFVGITAERTIYSVGRPSTDGFVANTSVTSGRAGTVAGCFHIPNAMFAVGTRLFRLTDSPTNSLTDATTAGEKNYEASGLSVTQQDKTISSRSLDLRRAGPRTESLTVQSSSVNGFNVQYLDPLAETFLVDASLFPQGVFITSVDFCFATVPADDIPIILEIRPVVNGYPSSNEILPCVSSEGLAIVTLRPDDVRTSAVPTFDDPNIYTRFNLPAPVYLLPGREYALVLRSDSNLYTAFTAELGATIIGSDAKIGKQPYAGSFFKSQNASTWTESPFEDLMFRVNRAVWNAQPATPLTGVLVARGVAPTANVTFDSFEFYPHEVQFSEQTGTGYALDIKPVNLATGDLTGQIATRYIVLPNEWTPLSLSGRSMLQGFGGSIASNNVTGRPYPFTGPTIAAANTVDALLTLATKSADVAPYIDLKKVNMLALQHFINDMSLRASDVIISNPGVGYLATLANGTVATTGGSNVVTGTATQFTNTYVIGDTIVIGGNLEFIVSSITNTTQLITTTNVTATRAANVIHTYGTLSGNNAVGVSIVDPVGTGAGAYVNVGRDGKIANIVFSANGSGYIDTPVLTVSAPSACTGYLIAQTTGVLAYNSELYASGGNGLTRYITRPVPLADGFEARDIQVIFDAYRPRGSHFYVYYKVLPGNADQARFDDQVWRPMKMTTNDTVVSTNYNQFKEFTFATINGSALDATLDTTDKFKVFAIKVVISGSSTVDVARLVNFRAIALDQ